MLTARVNGTDIAYTDSGGDGPAIVLSHGYLMDHTMFDPQLSVLAPEFRVITWDERGFGDTAADGPFSYWDSARDVLGLLDHLGLDRAVLGGMSQGGFLGLRAALLEPGRVPALVLIDTQAGQEDPALAPSYEQMEEIWLAQGPEPVQEIVASIILGDIDPLPWYAKWARLDRQGLTYSFRCLMDRDDITGRLGEIGCPGEPPRPPLRDEVVQGDGRVTVLAPDCEGDLAVVGLMRLRHHVVGGAEGHGPVGKVQQGEVLGVQIEVSERNRDHDELEQAVE